MAKAPISKSPIKKASKATPKKTKYVIKRGFCYESKDGQPVHIKATSEAIELPAEAIAQAKKIKGVI